MSHSWKQDFSSLKGNVSLESHLGEQTLPVWDGKYLQWFAFNRGKEWNQNGPTYNGHLIPSLFSFCCLTTVSVHGCVSKIFIQSKPTLHLKPVFLVSSFFNLFILFKVILCDVKNFCRALAISPQSKSLFFTYVQKVKLLIKRNEDTGGIAIDNNSFVSLTLHF